MLALVGEHFTSNLQVSFLKSCFVHGGAAGQTEVLRFDSFPIVTLLKTVSYPISWYQTRHTGWGSGWGKGGVLLRMLEPYTSVWWGLLVLVSWVLSVRLGPVILEVG